MEEINERKYLVPTSILIAAVVISATWAYTNNQKLAKETSPKEVTGSDNAVPTVGESLVMPVPKNILVELNKSGVLDETKFNALYGERGMSVGDKNFLDGLKNGQLVMNSGNAQLALNVLWAMGLGQKSAILTNGPLSDSSYGGAGGFASTGGWTLGTGTLADHLSMHSFVNLTTEQEQLVERVSKNIYRPCCNNSTHFPDCNHGMAMLGLLELLASQGTDELSMYKAALKANALWFPNQYATIERYLGARGLSLASASAQDILGKTYSSGSGFAQIAATAPTEPATRPTGGGGCSV
ncbi:MAG TPA: hypothetical protein VJG48_00150 [Candidatus Paceibacterota bacterium]